MARAAHPATCWVMLLCWPPPRCVQWAAVALTAGRALQPAAWPTRLPPLQARLGRLGSGSKALDTHLTFVRKMQDVLDTSVGRLVDADMAAESARLQSLQVKQQLAVQALSIANRTPSLLLQLFQR